MSSTADLNSIIDKNLEKLQISSPTNDCRICLKVIKPHDKYFVLPRREKTGPCSFDQSKLWDAIETLSFTRSDILLPESGKICRYCALKICTLTDSDSKKEEWLAKLENVPNKRNLLCENPTVEPNRGHCNHCYLLLQKGTHITSTMTSHFMTLLQVLNNIRQIKNIPPLIESKCRLCKNCVGAISSYQKAVDSATKALEIVQTHLPERRVRSSTDKTGVTPTSKKLKKGHQEGQDNGHAFVQFTDDEKTRFKSQLQTEMDFLIDNAGWKTSAASSSTSIRHLDFENMASLIKDGCPTLSLLFCEDDKGIPRIGPKEIMALAILGYSRNQRCNLLQKAIGFDIFRTASKEDMEILSDLGICTSRMTAFRTAEKINFENADRLNEWKLKEERLWKTDLQLPVSELQLTVRKGARRELLFEDETPGLSYMLQIDNLDYQQISRHQGTNRNTTMMHLTTGLFVRSRVPYIERNCKVSLAQSLPLTVFAPDKEDRKSAFLDIVRLLKQVAQANIASCQKTSTLSIAPLQYENKLNAKSDYVATGVLPIPLNSIKTAIKVVDELNKFLPGTDGEYLPFRIGGDGATFVLLHSAKSLKTASSPESTLNHVWISPSSSGLHRNMARMGRIFKIFGPNMVSQDSPGSLFHIRTVFGLKSATAKVTESYNHCYEMSELIMHGLGTLPLMKHLGITSPEDIPESGNYDMEALLNNAIENAAKEIMETVVCTPALLDKSCRNCSSKAVRGIQKCGSESCPHFIHAKCGLSNVESSKLVRRGQKKNLLFCSTNCSDRIYSYAMSLLHFCLLQKARRDSCRYVDASKMQRQNKEDLEFFFLNGNTQYTRICHHAVLGENGCFPQQIAFDEKYNSTVSIHGGSGKNLPLDHANECKVRADKREIKQQSGAGSLKCTALRTKLGQASTDVHESLQNFVPHRQRHSIHKLRQYTVETKEFVKVYSRENLVQKVGSRAHRGCENYQYRVNVVDDKIHTKIKCLSEEFDLTIQLAENYRSLEVLNKELDEYQNPTLLSGKMEWISPYSFEQEPGVSNVLRRFPNLHVPNDLQFEMSVALMEGRDVVVSLPCGFGKSYVYVFATLMIHTQHYREKTTTIIVSPLLSIINDQCRMLAALGLSSIHITNDCHNLENKLSDAESVAVNGVLFALITPELLENLSVRKIISSINPVLCCVDEAHLIHDWGNDEFRTAFRQIGNIRAFYRGPMLAMSATLTEDAYNVIVKELNIRPQAYVSMTSANRPNIFYSILPSKTLNNFVDSIIDGLKLYGPKFPKTILYVDSMAEMNKLYRNIMRYLQNKAYFGETNCFQSRMIHLYYSDQDDETKRFIEERFRQAGSIIRIVIATVAFGLGVDIPDIRISTYIQSSQKAAVQVAQYLQCIGRAARDGEPGIGIIFSRNLTYPGCLRDGLHSSFRVEGEQLKSLPYVCGHQLECDDACEYDCLCPDCICCDFCRSSCPCQGNIGKNYLEYFLPNKSSYRLIDEFADEEDDND